MTQRDNLTEQAGNVGELLNDLRQRLAGENYGFCVGLVRAAEEAVLVAYNSLKDGGVGEEEL